MSKIKVLSSTFPCLQITASGSCIFIKTKWWQQLGEAVHAGTFKSLEAVSEEGVKRAGGTIGWGAVGGAVAGPLGAVAGLALGGRSNDTTFTAVLKNGDKFIGIVDTKTFNKLKAATLSLY